MNGGSGNWKALYEEEERINRRTAGWKMLLLELKGKLKMFICQLWKLSAGTV